MFGFLVAGLGSIRVRLSTQPQSRPARPFVVSEPRCGDSVRVVVLEPSGEPAFDSGRFEILGDNWSVAPSLSGDSGTVLELRVVCDIGDRSTVNVRESLTLR